MTGPAAEVAELRTALRRALEQIACPAGTPLLVACSGGADSTALAAAAAYLSGGAGREGWPVSGAVVDHGLQPGSAKRARRTVELLERLGIPGTVLTVEVSGPGGMEAAARRARYAALRAARPTPESPVLLGHTLDDQAETVLLGLGRGSGARSMAGMARYDPPWLRPLLGVRRATTRAACDALGLPVWDDPHNADPRFTRVRLRREVLPLMEDVLAGGVAGALARTAAQLAEDLAALDEMAAQARHAVEVDGPEHSGLDAETLAEYPAAVRRRVLRAWLLDAGVRELSDARLRSADDLVGRWHGQGGLALRGGRELARERGRLVLRPSHTVVARPAPASTDSDTHGGTECNTDSGNAHDLS
ncbi:MAG TPA: tRNA lysidine(34) synthetase TilS [Pseudonocardia sp.]|nr:tRNA lysidine(34) synthetase TilS [Pseudonocardia sp.]